MYVQIHTVCELTHSVQNYTVVPFAYNMKKIPLTWIFLHSRRDWRDWQIWGMCMCVFVYLYFCIYVFNTWEYQFLISLKNPLFKYSSSYDRRHCPLSINISYVVSGMIMGRVDRGVPRGPRGPKKRSAMC